MKEQRIEQFDLYLFLRGCRDAKVKPLLQCYPSHLRRPALKDRLGAEYDRRGWMYDLELDPTEREDLFFKVDGDLKLRSPLPCPVGWFVALAVIRGDEDKDLAVFPRNFTPGFAFKFPLALSLLCLTAGGGALC